MIDLNKFLEPPTYDLTAAARMALTGLEPLYPGVQSRLQVQHTGLLRHCIQFVAQRTGVVLVTDGPYNLCVIDSILPDDYARRTTICMDTELEDVRIKMFRASGLIPTNKEE